MINIYKFIKQFSKFAVVGVIGAIIHLGLLFVLTEFISIYYILSSVIGFILANIFTFVLNKTWTFGDRLKNKKSPKHEYFEYSKFFVVSIIAVFLNISILFLLTEFFHLYYILSQMIASIISLWINFFGNKFWTFRE